MNDVTMAHISMLCKKCTSISTHYAENQIKEEVTKRPNDNLIPTIEPE
jgi:hypothetical protein